MPTSFSVATLLVLLPAGLWGARWLALASDVDAVFVSTPEQEHAEPIKRALLAGKPVLCDKGGVSITYRTRCGAAGDGPIASVTPRLPCLPHRTHDR